MRVLHLTTHLNTGGITTYIEKLIRPLAFAGIETLVLSSGGEQTLTFQEKGAKTFNFLPRTKSELDPRLWFALPRLLMFMNKQKIDVLHAHTRVTQVLACAAGRISGVPVVTTAHGFFKKRLGRSLFPCWGDKTVAISPLVAETILKDYGLNPSRLQTVLNAVDIEELDRSFSRLDPAEAKAHFGFSASGKVAGIVARHVEDKGHEYLIRAIALLKKEMPEIRLLVVGDGKHRQALENLTVQLNLQSEVRFTGNLPDVSLPLAAMDVFVLPATWREGFGLSVIEAMTCRRPVIVSNIWALNDLIKDGETGILVEPKNPEALAAAIRDVFQKPQETARRVQIARTQVERSFSILRMRDEIKQVYRDVSGLKPTKPRS